MKKYFSLLLLLIMVCILSSCNVVSKVKTFTNSRTEMLNSANEDEVAEEKLTQIIEYINNKDKEGLESMFSNNALDESEDFSENADLLFDFFEGEVISWEEDSGPGVSESTSNGEVVKEVNSNYYVKTDKNTYFFWINDFQIDDTNEDNEGINRLVVVLKEDCMDIFENENEMIYDKDGNEIERHGIYLPILEK